VRQHAPHDKTATEIALLAVDGDRRHGDMSSLAGGNQA
jgi:hypothetical protein